MIVGVAVAAAVDAGEIVPDAGVVAAAEEKPVRG